MALNPNKDYVQLLLADGRTLYKEVDFNTGCLLPTGTLTSSQISSLIPTLGAPPSGYAWDTRDCSGGGGGDGGNPDGTAMVTVSSLPAVQGVLNTLMPFVNPSDISLSIGSYDAVNKEWYANVSMINKSGKTAYVFYCEHFYLVSQFNNSIPLPVHETILIQFYWTDGSQPDWHKRNQLYASHDATKVKLT